MKKKLVAKNFIRYSLFYHFCPVLFLFFAVNMHIPFIIEQINCTFFFRREGARKRNCVGWVEVAWVSADSPFLPTGPSPRVGLTLLGGKCYSRLHFKGGK